MEGWSNIQAGLISRCLLYLTGLIEQYCTPGIPPEPPAAYGPAIVPGLPQRHGTGGRGRQPAPPQGASDKTSGSISTSMPSSASPGMPPEPPAVHGSLPGDDETASLPSLVSKLSPLAASKRPAGALSPTDVALFPTSPCTAECCLKEASHTPGALPSGGCPGNPICGLSARSAAPC